jgi:hypothetical protein
VPPALPSIGVQQLLVVLVAVLVIWSVMRPRNH